MSSTALFSTDAGRKCGCGVESPSFSDGEEPWSVSAALEILVTHDITGLPVVTADGTVVSSATVSLRT